jgi:hypothetical protein
LRAEAAAAVLTIPWSRQTRCGVRKQAARTEAGIMNPVKALENHAQSVWLDFLARGFISKGEL